MAARGARGDFFIWLCSVRGWGHIGEEIFVKENLLKKLGKKSAEARSAQVGRLSARNQSPN